MKQLWTWITGAWVTVGIVLAFAVPPIYDKATGLRLFTPQIAFFHVPAAVSMILAFMASAGYGISWLRTRQVRSDSLSFAFAEAGAILGCIAMATGMLFAEANWGAYWSWDPQQVGVLATLLTYAALFALRGAVDDDARRRDLWAIYAIFGCAVALFGSAIYRRLLPDMATLHPKNTLITSDPLNRFALWFNVLGYALFMARVAMVRARLIGVGERRRARIMERELEINGAAEPTLSDVESRGERETPKRGLVWR